ncbi:hypothetical protein D3C87_1947790 [compost metagenome]
MPWEHPVLHMVQNSEYVAVVHGLHQLACNFVNIAYTAPVRGATSAFAVVQTDIHFLVNISGDADVISGFPRPVVIENALHVRKSAQVLL